MWVNHREHSIYVIYGLCTILAEIRCWQFDHLSNMDDDAPTGTDNVITEFENYEQFLDSQITAVDLFYLEVWWYDSKLEE